MTTLTAFGDIHGHIRAPQQGRHIVAMLRDERNSNASSDSESMIIN